MTKILKLSKRVMCLTMVVFMMAALLPLNVFAAKPNIVIINSSVNGSDKGSNVIIVKDEPTEPKAKSVDSEVDYAPVALDEAVTGQVVLPNGVDVDSFVENTVTDGTNYYATLQAAVEAVCGNKDAVLYCKPDADVGSLQHAPVTATLTVYGNGAKVTGGAERDFDIGNTDPSGGKDITADMTLTVKNLNGCGAWGAMATANTVNLVFEDCANMGKVFLTGTMGTLNITMTNCAFEGVIKEAVYSNADGAITLTNVDFSNLNKAINLNHKATGTQTVNLSGCAFINCGNDVANDQIPVRILSSVDGGKSVLTVSKCTFSGTPEGGADILLAYGKGSTMASISDTTANVTTEKTVNEAIENMIEDEETFVFDNKAPVAKIGEVGYLTLADALAAAKTMTGDVVVEIYDKVTLNGPIFGSFDSIKFVGKEADAEIYLDVQGYITATGKKVAFENLTLSKSAGGYIANAGFMNVAFGVYDVTEVTYKNCTFANGAYASSGKVTFTECTFKRSHDKYSLWAYGNVDIVVDNCIFDDYRGIKMYAEGGAKTVDLTVKNTNFSAVSNKPAIVLTFGEKVTLEGNTYSSTGVFELDLDGAPNGTTVTSDVAPTCTNDNGPCGVLVDGKIYTTVAQAAAVATSGSTVTLLHNSTETVELPMGVTLNNNNFEAAGVTVAQPVAQIGETKYSSLQAAINAVQNGETIEFVGDITEELVTIEKASGVAFTIDGKGFKFTGEFEVGIGESITIQNVYFVASAEISPEYFIDSMDKNSNCVLTIRNCTFTDTDYSTTAIGTHQPTKVVIDYCTAAGVASLLQNQGGYNITVKNTTVEGKRGMSLGSVVGATVENVTIKAADDKYGIRLNGENANNTITINDCDITAFIPVVVRQAKVENYAIVFDGVNTMTAKNTDGLWCVIGTSEYEKNGMMPTEPTAVVKITLKDTGLDAKGLYNPIIRLEGFGTAEDPYVINNAEELFFFAKKVNDGTYKNVYVKLNSDIDLGQEAWTPIGNSTNPFLGTFDGNGHTISNLKVTPTSGNAGLFGQVATQIEGTNGTVKNLIVKNATIIALDQGNAGIIAVAPLGALVENVKLTGEIFIQGYRGVGGIVGNGFPRINNCTVEAEGTIHATYWGSGAILGFANDKGAKVMNAIVKGTGNGLTVSSDLGGVGGVTGTPHGAATNGATVANISISSNNNYYMAYIDASGAVKGNVVVEEVVVKVNGEEIVGCDVVATIGTTNYFSLQAAINAVLDGETIVLLRNITVDTNSRVSSGEGWYEGLYYTGDKSFTIDLNGKTFTQDGSVNDYLMLFKNDGSKDNTITLKNGTIDAGTTAYCAICTSTTSTKKITINLENINVINNNSNGSTIKVRGGSVLNVKAGTVITGKDSYLGIECVASTVNIYNGAEIYMNGTSSYNGCLVGACSNGTVNVYGGYGKGVSGGFIAMTSGGTINVYGGEWIANTDGTYANDNKSVLVAQSEKGAKSIIKVTGGIFKGGYNCYGAAVGDAQIVIAGGNFNADPSSYLAEGYVAQNTNEVYEVFKPVAQIGEVYYHDLHEAMVACKARETVLLLANVDLAGTEWEPVSFKGTFDGQNYTIRNLTINKPGVSNVGFITSLNGTFKNVTFTNPTVTGGEGTGVVAGRAGGSAARAENITVNGTIKVETTHSGYARAGVIVGGWAYGNYINITVDGYDKAVSYIKHTGGGDGRYVAGIVGHADDVDSYVNCTVQNITISGGWLCGGIAGPGPSNGIASDCVVENINIGADYSGGMFGWYFGSGTIQDSTIKEVTFTDGTNNNGAIGGYSANTNATISNVTITNVTNGNAPLLEHVAKINGTYYFSLADAFAAIGSDEVVIILLADATLDYGAREAYGLTDTDSITIDGNGHTLTLNQTNSDWSSIGMKNADGKLTLKNMTIEKTGHGDTNGAWNKHAIIFSCNVEMNNVTVNNSVAVQNGATLNNVTIKEAGDYYGLWINGNGQSVTVNGGEINAVNGRAIKIADQYIDTPASVTLTVDGTKFNTAKKAAVLVSSTGGAAITATNVNITGVAADSTNVAWVDEDWAANYGNVTVNDAPAAQEGAENFIVAIVDGEKILGYYKTLQDAINSAEASATVKLLADVTLSEIVKVENAITLDLGGKKVTSTAKKAFEIYANATIQNGTIEGANRCVDTRKSVKLTLTGVTLVADNYTSAYGNPQPLTIGGSENGTEVIMNSVTISANAGYGIITFVKTKLSATDSTISGYSALYVKPGSEGSTFDFENCDLSGSTGTNDVEGNSFSTIAVRANNVTVNVDANSTITAIGNYSYAISLGGNLESEKFVMDAKVTIAGAIIGNILSKAPVNNNVVAVGSIYANALKADGYVVSDAKDGMISVIGVILDVSDKDSLLAAIANAKPGDIIKLEANVDLTNETLVLNKGITLDLNGKTLTVDYLVAFNGNHVIDSTRGAGLLIVAKDHVMLSTGNANMAVWTETTAGNGYKFAQVKMRIQSHLTEYDAVNNGFKIFFRPSVGPELNTILKKDTAINNSGLQYIVRVSWENEKGDLRYQDFVYSVGFIENLYTIDKYCLDLKVTGLSHTDKHKNVKATVIIKSETGVEASEIACVYQDLLT